MDNAVLIIDSDSPVIDLTRTVPAGQNFKIQLINIGRKADLEVKGHITVERGAVLEFLQIDLGRFNCSTDVSIEAKEGSDITAHLDGMAEGEEEKLYRIDVLHEDPQASSLISMRGVCNGESHMEFLSCSDIRKGAVKTHTRQDGKIVNLSGRAKCAVSPSLLIAEEDVFASHGASMGSVPDDDIFYLMSRGLSREIAERLITLGYLKPACEMILDEEARGKALSLLEELL